MEKLKIYAKTIEEEAKEMVYSLAKHEAFKNSQIRVMPDAHLGKGAVIGFTAPIGELINPSVVGVDIGCMIDTYITDLKLSPEDYPLIEYRIRKEIPFGININPNCQIDYKEFYEFMSKGLRRAKSLWPEAVDSLSYADEEGISDLCQKIGMDEGKFYKSLGSVGGGNHFIEIGETPEGYCAFTIHCGSRNFGVKVCKYWETKATKEKYNKEAFREGLAALKKNIKDKRQLPEEIKNLKKKLESLAPPVGYLKGEDLVGYITDMAIAQLYSEFNHLVISRKIINILKCKVTERIASIHNYIDYQDHIIRKGAIRSYKGEKMVIPFNMRDGLAICVGKSNPDWNYSAPHGCGRLLSRNKAKETLSVNDFKNQMVGIYSTSVNQFTLDEAPDAYKPYEEILGLIEPTCEVLYLIKPLINLKSSDGTE